VVTNSLVGAAVATAIAPARRWTGPAMARTSKPN
jgi:hypothetical protein